MTHRVIISCLTRTGTTCAGSSHPPMRSNTSALCSSCGISPCRAVDVSPMRPAQRSLRARAGSSHCFAPAASAPVWHNARPRLRVTSSICASSCASWTQKGSRTSPISMRAHCSAFSARSSDGLTKRDCRWRAIQCRSTWTCSCICTGFGLRLATVSLSTPALVRARQAARAFARQTAATGLIPLKRLPSH
jgi:hypothetical protein